MAKIYLKVGSELKNNERTRGIFLDYKIWSISGRKYSLGNFSFCLFPFVYDAQSKAALLRVESQITQVRFLISGPPIISVF